jgi:hypothetical protein
LTGAGVKRKRGERDERWGKTEAAKRGPRVGDRERERSGAG